MSEENERAIAYVKEHIDSLRSYLLDLNINNSSYDASSFNIIVRSKKEELDLLVYILRSLQAINAVGDIMDIFNKSIQPFAMPKDKSNIISLVKE